MQTRFYHLHPTMYLLIRTWNCYISDRSKFTSHYVSINSFLLILLNSYALSFTSHYVSINSRTLDSFHGFPLLFTSHYVSINSDAEKAESADEVNLHPTMYLLIRTPRRLFPGQSNLHPTMYLLIPVIIKASLFLNSEALFCLPFKSANRLLILYALNMLEA